MDNNIPNDIPPVEDDFEEDNEFNSEDFDNNEEENNMFDSNFDAGVEANEEEDPKKYIEQLTGKLSQSLNKYQENQPQVDVETSKYVAGMIIKAATKGLDEKDVTDILNKVKEDSQDNEEEENDSDNNELDTNNELGDEFDTNDELDNEMQESISKRNKIEEIFQDITDSNNDNNIENKPIDNISFRKKPFTSPTF